MHQQISTIAILSAWCHIIYAVAVTASLRLQPRFSKISWEFLMNEFGSYMYIICNIISQFDEANLRIWCITNLLLSLLPCIFFMRAYRFVILHSRVAGVGCAPIVPYYGLGLFSNPHPYHSVISSHGFLVSSTRFHSSKQYWVDMQFARLQ